MVPVIDPDSLPGKLPGEAHATTAHDHDAGGSLLPFVFAKRHGILIRGPQDGSYLTIVRENANAASLGEARRAADQAARNVGGEAAQGAACAASVGRLSALTAAQHAFHQFRHVHRSPLRLLIRRFVESVFGGGGVPRQRRVALVRRESRAGRRPAPPTDARARSALVRPAPPPRDREGRPRQRTPGPVLSLY